MLSVVIPTYNEEKNIKRLVERISDTLTTSKINYELIFVDDHSTDNTLTVLEDLAKTYPINFLLKEGTKGKSYSLLQGFQKAQGEYIAMIDGDLQYPPEAIPDMMEHIENGADIVVANRNYLNVNILRKITSKSFMYLFGDILHGLKCDVQSGLKVFKKEIIKSIVLNPTPWTFDLEFLVKAKNAGYKIDTINILFEERHYGQSKVNLLQTTWEIGIGAIKTKLETDNIIPFNETGKNNEGLGFHHNNNKYVTHTKLDFQESAFYRLNFSQKVLITTVLVLLVSSLIINWHTSVVIILGFLTFIYFSDILFNLVLILRTYTKNPEIRVEKSELTNFDGKLPKYSILCPLYKEWQIIPQFINAISHIDYPKNKLQVLLLLEEDDKETQDKVKEFDLPNYFQVEIIPNSQPKTKPKACNFGLSKIVGEYCVIYDAEDIPEKDQLRKVVKAFEKLPNKTTCIQAKLNYYNPNQNLLTKLFTSEYSLWFDLVLPGLQTINAPIPLGGTSNHFRAKTLKNLGGWDPFNVTEDCDLGIRLAKKGFKTAIIDSTTYEEANSELKNWFWQRTRWIKGYIQTYLVHTRNFQAFSRHTNPLHFLTFQLVVGGKIFSMFINPIMWITTISYFAFRPVVGTFIESFYPAPILYMGVISLVFGNFLYFYYYMLGSAKRGDFDLIKYAFIIPFYWIFISLAAIVAVYKLIREPYYWSKTKHGLHLPSSQPAFPKIIPQPTFGFKTAYFNEVKKEKN